jgi:hypothetical protein
MVPPIVDGRILATFEDEAICHALVEKTLLKEACNSLTFVCDEAMLYDTWHTFKDVFITQVTLTCANHVEPFF